MKTIALAILASMTLVGQALAAPPVGQVTDIIGQAIAHRAGGAKEKLKPLSPIYQGDKLETATKSKLKVLFTDESVISLAPGTQLLVNEMVFNPGKQERTGLLALIKGRVRGFVGRYASGFKSSYKIATPTAVAGIRGSIFTYGYGESNTNEFCAMEEGEVEWCQGSNCITVPANSVGYIGPDGKWVPPTNLSQSDIANLIGPALFGNQGSGEGEGGGGLDGDPIDLTPPEGGEGGGLPPHPPLDPRFNTDERNTNFDLFSGRVINLELIFDPPAGGG
ncbi:MAG: FecR family protein [Bdellovibrionota bacterium]